jgi:hypothetical protein
MPTPNPEQFIEKIEAVGSGGGVSSSMSGFVAEPETRVAPNKEHFDSLYTKAAENDVPVRKVPETERISLMDEISNVNKQVNAMKIAPTDQIVAQIDEAVGRIRTLRTQLEAPGAVVKAEWQSTLRNKLTHIDETLRVTLNRAGLEYREPEIVTAPANPIERFLGFLENGQKQLESLGSEVTRIQGLPSMSPQEMLGMQYNVNLVQQQLELFTSLLNKALESTKTVMNTQV